MDLPGEDPRIQRVVAGYMTLGDYKSEGFIDMLVSTHYNAEGLDLAAYDTGGQRFFYYKYDADNDGTLNHEEWEFASPNNSIANIQSFVEAALDGMPADEGEQTAFTHDPLVDLFSPEMDALFASVDYEPVLENLPETNGGLDAQTSAVLMSMMGVFDMPVGLCPYCLLCAPKFNFQAYPKVSGLAFSDLTFQDSVTFQVGGSSTNYPGTKSSTLAIPAGMEIRNLEITHAKHFNFVEWRAPGSLLDQTRDKKVASVTLFDDTVAQAVLANGVVDIATSSYGAYSVTVQAPPGALDNEPGREEHHRRVVAPRNELVSLAFESNIPGQLVFAMTWSGHHHQSYDGLVVPCGGPLADPPLYSPRFNDEIYAGLKYAILWATDGGRLFASNTTSAGGTYAGVLAFGEEVSFQAVPWPGYKFVRLEFYEGGDKYPYMTSNDALTNHWCWARSKYTVAKAVFAPKDECKLDLETKVTPSGTPGDDCPGYVVVEERKQIGDVLYQSPKRYYPKKGWVRLRPVANPGYRFVKWDAGEEVEGAVLTFWGPIHWPVKDLEVEEIAVRLDKDTTLRAVFEPHITLQFGLLEGGPYKDVDPPDLRSIHEHPDYELASDNVPVWIGALTQDTVWFRVPQMQNCGDTISWTGAASGTGWRKSVYFDAAGDFEVTATWGELTRTARVKVCTYPDESRLDWAA